MALLRGMRSPSNLELSRRMQSRVLCKPLVHSLWNLSVSAGVSELQVESVSWSTAQPEPEPNANATPFSTAPAETEI